MNGIDFPVAKVLDGIDAALEAGLTPVKVNMVVRRGVNEASIVPMARWARETGVTLRFIEYMDVGHSNGWRLDEVVPAAGAHRHGDRRLARRARRRRLSRRGRRPLAVRGRARRVRDHLVGHPAVLPRLHARPPVGRRQAVHVPVRRRAAATSGPSCATARPTRRWRRSSPRPGAPGTTATRSCGRSRRPTCRRSRCSRWAAERRSASPTSLRPQGYPHPDHRPDIPWTGVARSVRCSWISALTVGRAGR